MLKFRMMKGKRKNNLLVMIDTEKLCDAPNSLDNLFRALRGKLVYEQSVVECERLIALKAEADRDWEGKKEGVLHPYVEHDNWVRRNRERHKNDPKT